MPDEEAGLERLNGWLTVTQLIQNLSKAIIYIYIYTNQLTMLLEDMNSLLCIT